MNPKLECKEVPPNIKLKFENSSDSWKFSKAAASFIEHPPRKKKTTLGLVEIIPSSYGKTFSFSKILALYDFSFTTSSR